MNRRGFLKGLGGILAAGVAPAVVGSGVLMPVRKIITLGDIEFNGPWAQYLNPVTGEYGPTCFFANRIWWQEEKGRVVFYSKPVYWNEAIATPPSHPA